MTNDGQLLPPDDDARRRLWIEWIHVDLPANASNGPSRRLDAARPRTAQDDWLRGVLPASAGVVEGLSAAVRESLVGAELPASDRARLLRRAVRLGLNRFEANLLIAAVQHRARGVDATPRFVATLPPEQRRFGIAKLVACAVVVEAIVGGAAIHLLTR